MRGRNGRVKKISLAIPKYSKIQVVAGEDINPGICGQQLQLYL